MDDMYYIDLEDITANAMIEILVKRQEDAKNMSKHLIVTFRDLEEYGTTVVDYINQNLGKHAVMLLSRNSTANMFRNYSEFFEEVEGIEPAIRLREGKTVDELIKQFRTYLSFTVLQAFLADETKIAILQKYD